MGTCVLDTIVNPIIYVYYFILYIRQICFISDVKYYNWAFEMVNTFFNLMRMALVICSRIILFNNENWKYTTISMFLMLSSLLFDLFKENWSFYMLKPPFSGWHTIYTRIYNNNNRSNKKFAHEIRPISAWLCFFWPGLHMASGKLSSYTQRQI